MTSLGVKPDSYGVSDLGGRFLLKFLVIPANSLVIPANSLVIPANSLVIPANSLVIPAKAGIQDDFYQCNVLIYKERMHDDFRAR